MTSLIYARVFSKWIENDIITKDELGTIKKRIDIFINWLFIIIVVSEIRYQDRLTHVPASNVS